MVLSAAISTRSDTAHDPFSEPTLCLGVFV